jgi:3-isopropylmalate dehydrogenase
MAETGKPWPNGTFEICRDSTHAILLGAIGRPNSPKSIELGKRTPGNEIVLGLRSKLDLYANIRPVYLFKNVFHDISGEFKQVWSFDKVNLIIVRENTEGFYTGKSEIRDNSTISTSQDKDNLEVIDIRKITRKGSERIIEFAFNLANQRFGAPFDNIKRVTCVDKSNVLDGCRLFREVFTSISKKYSNIEPDFMYIDAFTQKLLQKPEHFDVVVTTNLFGDIITDLAAILQGGLGMAPSANLGEHHGMFEPVHGSAPDIAGKNVANPIGMILSVQMMLKWLGEKKNNKEMSRISKSLFTAVKNYLANGEDFPIDLGGNANTSSVTQKIVNHLINLES